VIDNLKKDESLSAYLTEKKGTKTGLFVISQKWEKSGEQQENKGKQWLIGTSNQARREMNNGGERMTHRKMNKNK
jgi:hypothetical protein